MADLTPPIVAEEPMPNNVHQEAYALLQRFYEQIVDRAAHEIVDAGDGFGDPYTGKGEPLVERYAPLLGQICHLMSHLGGKPAAGKVQVETIGCPLDDAAKRLQDWFDRHPQAGPIAVQIVPGNPFGPSGAECTVLLIHRAGKPNAEAE